jgi:hypothetical protein
MYCFLCLGIKVAFYYVHPRPLEREYIFSLDSTSIIKSGKNPAALKDLKPRYTAKVGYSEKGSRKTVSSIILKP